MSHRFRARLVLGVTIACLAAACQGASESRSTSTAPISGPSADASPSAQQVVPVTLANCGVDVSVKAAPRRAVSMNQGATEIMLTLGLEGRMVGTAYLDDPILPELARAYGSIPVLAPEYPSREVVLGAEPDFVYGSYSSAFTPDAAGTRAELKALGIETYVSPMACEDRSLRPARVTFEDVFGEIRDIGRVFGVGDRAAGLVTGFQADLKTATSAGAVGAGLTVVWYDSGTEAPTVGACCGAPGMMMRELGLTNAFDNVEGSWADVSWEAFVKADPDVIVLADASWDLAAERQVFLASDAATRNLQAVRNRRYVVVPFSATTAGIRNVGAVDVIARYVKANLKP